MILLSLIVLILAVVFFVVEIYLKRVPYFALGSTILYLVLTAGWGHLR